MRVSQKLELLPLHISIPSLSLLSLHPKLPFLELMNPGPFHLTLAVEREGTFGRREAAFDFCPRSACTKAGKQGKCKREKGFGCWVDTSRPKK